MLISIKKNDIQNVYDWPFSDLGFLLVHTGEKLSTHLYLENLNNLDDVEDLEEQVLKVQHAFSTRNSNLLIEGINGFHQNLQERLLVAPHTLICLEKLSKNPYIVALKGCGAMGADVIFILVTKEKEDLVSSRLKEEGWSILARTAILYKP